MKMVQKKTIKWRFLIILSLIAFQSIEASDLNTETHQMLINLNKNWAELAHEIRHRYTPNSEQELVQLHLLNVVSYLESLPLTNLSKDQIKNRQSNISILRNYSLAGAFPKNNATTYRIPIFIDFQNRHCAVGHLLKENGLGAVAQEIASKQLFNYLKDIEHPKLDAWQRISGLSLFELALIQPTYGPAIPVCAAPSPIQWNKVPAEDSKITRLFKSETENYIYGISNLDALGWKQEIKSYAQTTQQWTSVGSIITGQILDLTFCNEQAFISVLLPDANYPHQLLRLNGSKWEKIAHFNGSINSMQVLESKLYVLGNFTITNDSITSNLVVVDNYRITPFNPVFIKNTLFDHMKSSKTALFLTSNGLIYKFKNDTINYLSNIKHYQYISNIMLDAEEDTVFITSTKIPGYNKYFDNREQTFSLNNALYGQDFQYHPIHFTKSKMVRGNMILAGDFKSSTLIPQINENKYLMKCATSTTGHWYGGGLLYQSDQVYYPILENGIVMDFIHLDDRIYILKNDGSIRYANLNLIEEQIAKSKIRA